MFKAPCWNHIPPPPSKKTNYPSLLFNFSSYCNFSHFSIIYIGDYLNHPCTTRKHVMFKAPSAFWKNKLCQFLFLMVLSKWNDVDIINICTFVQFTFIFKILHLKISWNYSAFSLKKVIINIKLLFTFLFSSLDVRKKFKELSRQPWALCSCATTGVESTCLGLVEELIWAKEIYRFVLFTILNKLKQY